MEILCLVTIHRLHVYILTEILKVNSNLMHATSERFTQNNTRLAIITELLESRRTILTLW